jgi:hypothetical protein
MFKKLAIVPICLACLSSCAGPRDAMTVIADAQKALGGVTSVTCHPPDTAGQLGVGAADLTTDHRLPPAEELFGPEQRVAHRVHLGSSPSTGPELSPVGRCRH